MISDLDDYIENHISPEPEELTKIDRHTNLYRLNGRMCSGHIQGRLLKMLTSMIRPLKILEIGTFTAYSALCMAEALSEEGRVYTIEIDDELAEEIKSNLDSSPHGHKVVMHIGDALEFIDSFPPESFDMVLIDGDKRQYPQYLTKVIPLVKPGGFILADNTLWDGHVMESGRHSTQTKGIMDFNDMAVKIADAEVAMIPIRDGITLIRKSS